MKKIVYLILVCQLLISGAVFAAQAFVVKNIEVQGLQNIDAATVVSDLPIKRGQVLQPAKTSEILRELYETQFFDHITLSREGNTLIIHVTERPIIGQLKITGNSVIPTDKLLAVMKSLGISEGRVYNPVVVDRVRQSLLSQYYQLGRYNARVNVAVSSLSRNRVAIQITISEGLVAKVRRISIIGNHVFSERTLTKQLDVTKTGLFTFFTQTDRYSEQKLDASLEKLRGYYLDHGYLHFEIKSSQAQVTPDRKAVYITIVVIEGEPYTVKNYQFTGELLGPYSDYVKLSKVKPGETFSRQKLVDTEKAVTNYLGDKGYVFATVTVHPQINDQTRQVFLVFEVKPGKRAYVRHISFIQNTRTNDTVLRRRLTQMEAAPASTSKLEESKHNLSLLPYIKNVDMSVTPAVDSEDQVDVNYKVEEENAAQASLKIGYSQLYGKILGAGLDQKNFFGTGNTLGISFSRSQYEQYYGINYTDPYYTADGISRSFNFSISRTDPEEVGLNFGYTTNEYDAGVLYGIPIGQEMGVINTFQAGLGYKNTLVNLAGSVPDQVTGYLNDHGRRAQELDLTLGYSRDSRDKAVFPTSGALQTLYLDTYAPLDHDSVSFYQLNYHGKWYQPITDQYIILSRADLGYGNGLHGVRSYPFFRNYYAGGINSVRGYEDFTLGPLDSQGNPFGGNMLVDASVGMIFPNYITDSLRTTVFVDAGNVYTSLNNRSFGGQSTNSGPIRYSTGIEADWLTPFGPIEISLSEPFKLKGDKAQNFQFALGANF